MPNKTIYVSEGDVPLYQRAQELAGGNLSAAISSALQRYVDLHDSLRAGFEEITVRVGVGNGRKVRFTAALVGEWLDATNDRMAAYHVYRGPKGRFVLHIERSPQYWTTDADGRPAGWRGMLGIGDLRYGGTPREATLEIVDTLEELRDKIPPELFDIVSRSARQPTLEQLDV